MKILFLTRLFYPHIGGVEKHVYEVSQELIKQGHIVTVITEHLPNTQTEEMYDGIKIIRFHAGMENKEKKFRIWKWFLHNQHYIKDADIVHCHDVFFWYLPLRFMFFTKKNYITFHGYETVYPPRFSAVFVRKISEILSNGNICIGKFITKWYWTHPTFISYGGVRKDELTKDKYIENNRLNILFLGRLEKDTGLHVYFQMLEELKKKEIKFTITFCGDGSLRKDAEENGQVLGFVHNVTPYIDKADVVLTSSYLSILQTFARKRLVVATYDNNLKKDYLTLTPFTEAMVISNEPYEIASILLAFEEHKKEYFEEIEKGYDWVKNNTWHEVTNTYLKLWQK